MSRLVKQIGLKSGVMSLRDLLHVLGNVHDALPSRRAALTFTSQQVEGGKSYMVSSGSEAFDRLLRSLWLNDQMNWKAIVVDWLHSRQEKLQTAAMDVNMTANDSRKTAAE